MNSALLKAESDNDVESALLTFAEFVLRVFYISLVYLVLGSLSTKLSC